MNQYIYTYYSIYLYIERESDREKELNGREHKQSR